MPIKIINYRSDLRQKANNLRKTGILAEVIMWNQLKARQIYNYRFRHQKPIGPYIVDFYCPKLKLVIEIDGYSHKDKINYDQKRDKYLQSLNLNILHFKDKEILNSIENIIMGLRMWIENSDQPPSRGKLSRSN